MLLRDFISHRPCLESYDGKRSIHRKAEHRSQASFRWAKLYTSRALQFKQSSFHLVMRVLRDITLQRLRVLPALMTCSVSVSLSASGKSLTQEPSSKFFLSATGILQCVKWRTRFTLEPAHMIQLSKYYRPILSQLSKSGKMSLYIFIHPRHEWTGLSKKDCVTFTDPAQSSSPTPPATLPAPANNPAQ